MFDVRWVREVLWLDRLPGLDATPPASDDAPAAGRTVLATTADHPVAGRAARAYGVDLDAVRSAERFTGRAGEVVRVPVVAPPGSGLPDRWLLVGTDGGSAAGGTQALRRAGAALGRAGRGHARLLLAVADAPDDLGALVEGVVLGAWTPPATGRKDRSDAAAVPTVAILRPPRRAGQQAAERAVARGLAAARATLTARDLAVTPSSTKTPAWLADRAGELAARAGLAVRVWDERDLAADGFGAILAVGAASASPPRLVRIDHWPAGARGRRVVLVGKGITFDTGGLSLKPREAMVPMKTDMSGAAAVLAAVLACAEAGVRRPVTALLPLAENTVGERAYRPDDVLRGFGGRTIEIANTDAEGRLVLADALAYADAELEPDVLVDLATLTGAATLGLGRRHAALFTPDDALAAAFEDAARETGEGVWRMPLVEEYATALDSTIADIRHVPRDGAIGAGAVTAAMFLRTFAGRRRWAHLDIAGVARSEADRHEVPKGATGYGARLLLHWLRTLR